MPSPFDSLPEVRQRGALIELAHASLPLWGLPATSRIHLVNITENATFRVEPDDGHPTYALRIHRHGYHGIDAIRSELAWLQALRLDGIVTTPVPVQGLDSDLVQLGRHTSMTEPRKIVLSRWEAGSEPGIGEDLRGPFERLGEVTARMHAHARAWQRPAGFVRHRWDFETSLGSRPHWGRWQDGMGMDRTKLDLFGRTVERIRDRLAAYGTGQERFGLVHGDLRLANLLVDGDTVKVIDFDDCGFSWFFYDAATPVSFHEHHPDVPDLLAHWLAGYRRVAPVDPEDEAEIPTFLMLRRLLLVAWIGSHSDTDLAREMGVEYTAGTAPLCEGYLASSR